MKYIPRYKANMGGNKKVHPLIPSRDDCNSYIYFLMKRRRVVYIGQTQSIRARVHVHNCYIDYDTIRFIRCSSEKLLYYENRWILRFMPKMNWYIPTKEKVLNDYLRMHRLKVA
jgi:excinuclease UvrABC nuclease subunit